MDRVTEFRQIIEKAIRAWAEYAKAPEGTEHVLIFDDKTDNYVWIHTGWEFGRHVNHTLIHLGIRGGKIHVFHDGVGDGIVADLLAAGVKEKEIVIEWHPPVRRKHTPFALA
jgi:hypothetical protein